MCIMCISVVLWQMAVETISSHKFLPLIYQLAARMSQSNTGFQAVLHQVRLSAYSATAGV